MKTAAVIIDAWKLSYFKQNLEKAGFKFKKFNGPTQGLITLKIKTDDVNSLAKTLKYIVANISKTKH